jgi:citrate synthase
MSEINWKTAITEIKPNQVRIRGYDVAELMGNLSFGATFYLLLKGELPTKEIGALMDAILVSSIDHGTSPPSILTTRTITSTGGALNAAVAGGVLAINQLHGGAIEECMVALKRGKELLDNGKSVFDAAKQLLVEYKDQGKKISGYGHRIHTKDPRTDRLFELARKAGVKGDYINLALHIINELAAKGKELPLNVDGAIAAVLCELDFDPEIANGFFILARTGGMIAHWKEEKDREKPMRKIHPSDCDYDGPPARKL